MAVIEKVGGILSVYGWHISRLSAFTYQSDITT